MTSWNDIARPSSRRNRSSEDDARWLWCAKCSPSRPVDDISMRLIEAYAHIDTEEIVEAQIRIDVVCHGVIKVHMIPLALVADHAPRLNGKYNVLRMGEFHRGCAFVRESMLQRNAPGAIADYQNHRIRNESRPPPPNRAHRIRLDEEKARRAADSIDLLRSIIEQSLRAFASAPAGLELDSGLGEHDYGTPLDDAADRFALLDLGDLPRR